MLSRCQIGPDGGSTAAALSEGTAVRPNLTQSNSIRYEGAALGELEGQQSLQELILGGASLMSGDIGAVGAKALAAGLGSTRP